MTTFDDQARRYTLGLAHDVRLGYEEKFKRTYPCAEIFRLDQIEQLRPQRITTNAHVPGFFYLTRVCIAGEEAVLVDGESAVDAYTYNPNAVGQHLDCKPLGPDDEVVVEGVYTGRIPSPLGGDDSPFRFTLALTGPALRTPLEPAAT